MASARPESESARTVASRLIAGGALFGGHDGNEITMILGFREHGYTAGVLRALRWSGCNALRMLHLGCALISPARSLCRHRWVCSEDSDGAAGSPQDPAAGPPQTIREHQYVCFPIHPTPYPHSCFQPSSRASYGYIAMRASRATTKVRRTTERFAVFECVCVCLGLSNDRCSFKLSPAVAMLSWAAPTHLPYLLTGNGAQMLRVFPYAAVQFFAHDRYSKVRHVLCPLLCSPPSPST
jgi:hypothetical protein